ncbi:hypothetical protein SAMN02745775_101252 [Falsiroseomonas stagni DSM 19981]|uniref:Uncharacterized protein n=2 Tax=Falsiroseomonas TaxID=2870713 RepID=A0A1I3XF57_9PROT|nr:hypothetical protein SAMN02745775_101252 [Falsiroseomonas stagni DSM 19981]
MPRASPALTPSANPDCTETLHTSMSRRYAPSLPDSRLVALCRAACAANPGLAAPFLATYWTEEHIDRTAFAAASLAAEIGDIAAQAVEPTAAVMAQRLTVLLTEARLLGGGRNSLAEHLTGRAGRHQDRLHAITTPDETPG